MTETLFIADATSQQVAAYVSDSTLDEFILVLDYGAIIVETGIQGPPGAPGSDSAVGSISIQDTVHTSLASAQTISSQSVIIINGPTVSTNSADPQVATAWNRTTSTLSPIQDSETWNLSVEFTINPLIADPSIQVQMVSSSATISSDSYTLELAAGSSTRISKSFSITKANSAAITSGIQFVLSTNLPVRIFNSSLTASRSRP